MNKISELLIGKLKKIQNIPIPHPTYCNRKPWPDHELCPQRQRQRQHLEHVESEESQGHPDVLRWHLNLSRLPSQFLHTKFHHVTFLLINQKILSPASMAQTHVLKHFPRAGSRLSGTTVPGAFSASPAHHSVMAAQDSHRASAASFVFLTIQSFACYTPCPKNPGFKDVAP